jgi:crossover junction endodeoxyribonuclease RusA
MPLLLTAIKNQVFVPGKAIPQGSTKAYVVRGRARVTSDNAETVPWRADVSAYVRAVVGSQIQYPSEAVALALEFRLPRRKAEPRRVTPAHTRKPDLDKLVRAICDALTGIVYTDDAQVVEMTVSKRTASLGEQPGALITWDLA